MKERWPETAKRYFGIFRNVKMNELFFFSLFARINPAQTENWLMEVISVTLQHIVPGFLNAWT